MAGKGAGQKQAAAEVAEQSLPSSYGGSLGSGPKENENTKEEEEQEATASRSGAELATIIHQGMSYTSSLRTARGRRRIEHRFARIISLQTI